MAGDEAFGPSQVATSPAGELTLVSVPVADEASGDLSIAKVRELRSDLIPAAFAGSGASVYVTGETAGNVDYMDIVDTYFPYVVGLVLALSFVRAATFGVLLSIEPGVAALTGFLILGQRLTLLECAAIAAVAIAAAGASWFDRDVRERRRARQ